MVFGWLKKIFSGTSQQASFKDDERSIQNVYTILTRLSRLRNQRNRERDVLQKIAICQEEGSLNDALDQTILQLENTEYTNLISLLEGANKDVTHFFNTLVLMEDSFQTPELLQIIDPAEAEIKRFAQMFGNAARNRDFVVGTEPVVGVTLKDITEAELLMSDIKLKRGDERAITMHMDNARKQIQFISQKWGTQEWTYPQMEADMRIVTNDIRQLNTLVQNVLDSARTILRNFRSIRSALLQEDNARLVELNALLKQEPSAIAAIESARIALQNYRTQAVSRGTTQEEAQGRRYAARVGAASSTLLETFRKGMGRKAIAGVTAATFMAPAVVGAAQAAYGNVNPPAVTASGFMQGQKEAQGTSKRFTLLPGGSKTTTTTDITHVATTGSEFVNFDIQHVVEGHFKFAKGDKVINQAQVTAQFEQIKNDLINQWHQSGIPTWQQFASTADIKVNVLVQGGADKVGPDGVNLHKYGQERANEGAADVNAFLDTLGIKNVKTTIVSSGESADPVFANNIRNRVIPSFDMILQQLEVQKRTTENDLAGLGNIKDIEKDIVQINSAIKKAEYDVKKGKTPQIKNDAQKLLAQLHEVLARRMHEKNILRDGKQNLEAIQKTIAKDKETYKLLLAAIAKYDGASGNKRKQSAAIDELVRIGHSRADLLAMYPDRTFEAQVLISGSFERGTITPGVQEHKVTQTKEWAPIIFFMKVPKKVANYNPAALPGGLAMQHTNWEAIQEMHNKPMNAPTRATGIHIGGYGAKTSIPQTGRK